MLDNVIDINYNPAQAARHYNTESLLAYKLPGRLLTRMPQYVILVTHIITTITGTTGIATITTGIGTVGSRFTGLNRPWLWSTPNGRSP
jgi:hypothetical protein